MVKFLSEKTYSISYIIVIIISNHIIIAICSLITLYV